MGKAARWNILYKHLTIVKTSGMGFSFVLEHSAAKHIYVKVLSRRQRG